MSAVKNLRAMFEQKGENSPPDRGRSPGVPFVSGAESPRPLAKVRTSFIAIEKDGRMGLTREGSQDSVPGIRKLSGGSSEMTTPTAGKEISNPFEKFERLTSTPKTFLRDQPIVESPQAKAEEKTATSPVKEVNVAQTPTAPIVKKEEVKTPEPALDGTAEKTVTPAPKPETKEPVNETSGANEEKKETTATKEATKPTTTTITPQSTVKPMTTSSTGKLDVKSAKSPVTTKPPKSPALRPQPNLAAPKQTPERKVSHTEKTMTPKAATPAAKASAPSSVKKPPPLHASPAATGFVKPKVKSPTRPVKLPPGLTTHTAASGSKVHGDSAQHASSLARSASRTSMSGTTSKAAPGKTLKRQSSTVGRSRPSIGPPPPQPAKDHAPKKEKPVDESFLARMMRPTQASANKVTQKVPISPPRHGPASRRTSPASKPRVKKAVSRPHSATSGHSAPSASQTSLAPAAEIVPASKSAEDDAKHAALDAVAEKTAVQEVAVLAEQAETAEEAVEAAKEVEGEITLPETSPGVKAVTNSMERMSVGSADSKAEVSGHSNDNTSSPSPSATEETEASVIDNKESHSEISAIAA
ncbi:uncharacterized protein PODANS_1_6350 [Podospora anserina S mat+]|uniref:Podospora anserina S mat+ genomic DNA chromosome 1, supercontig 1 n=1 Tax=Podospora anserina (strain S / ATCC MYA-4624 / DSM 980 / FGSC 10383) TaxID=515849 RepID=B2AB73_PODAN|nr:uncharacterized protein PODANS_1_6350 [Podospora anserina S mat+]CAP60335.1 unnamed protein product [Podospora anserina S mat+]CDP22974.1 Putative protein of unknown function [Podospora anserina S mat+]